MSSKTIVYIGAGVGSTAGSLIASLFGVDMLSLSSAFASLIGGAVGIYVAYKMIN